jgi:hypothetical protein
LRTVPEIAEQFSEAEIIELMVRCALYLRLGRLAAVLDMTEERPEGCRKPFGETATPWTDVSIAVRCPGDRADRQGAARV